jgi:hypothetical protein
MAMPCRSGLVIKRVTELLDEGLTHLHRGETRALAPGLAHHLLVFDLLSRQACGGWACFGV